ncbi:MAG: HU family DNA-binding protein [bacterium]|jgi:integration host factor subunit beta
MTKVDLIEKVASGINLTKKDTEVIVNTIFKSITEALSSKKDGKVELRGFGSFRVRQREARQGRNPQTGKPVRVPAKRAPYFKAGKELKELIDN